MHVIKRNGERKPFNIKQIRKQTLPATEGLKNITPEELEKGILMSLTPDIHTSTIQKMLIKSALTLIDESKPDCTYTAARLTLYDLYHKVKHIYKVEKKTKDIYDTITLQDYIDLNVEQDLLSDWYKKYTKEEIAALNKVIDSKRDLLYDYQGMITLVRRYLIKNVKDEITELPQHLHMAVAMFAAQNEEDKVKWAKKFYEIESKLEYINATPINKDGRRKNGSTISCLVGVTPDNLSGMFDTFKEVAEGSKLGSGWGWDWSAVRAKGADIANNKNAAGGKIPFLKIANDISNAVDQNGNRPGAFAVYINIWDIEIFDFIDMKKKNGEDRVRAQDLFPAINIDDLFMERLIADGKYTLFDPHDVPLLRNSYGKEFKKHYENYEKEFLKSPDDFNPNTKVVETKTVIKHVVNSLYNEGSPYIHFIDNSNNAHRYPELGKIHTSNLCTEIFQPTSETRTAVCNLGSINLARVNTKKDIRRVVRIAIRLLDNLIDISNYPSKKAEITQKERRSIGLGALGEAESIAQKFIHYGSDEHLEFIDEVYKTMRDTANRTTRALAKEKGSCIIEGVRNAYLMATAPNTTSGALAGTTNSHECAYNKVWTEDNVLGNHLVTAPNLTIENYPYYVNSYDVDQLKLIDATAIRTKYIDQGISHSVFLYPENLRESRLKEIIVYAWKKKLKSLYYWRSKPPSKTKTRNQKISCVGCEN